MDLDAARDNILKEERAGGLPRRGSLAAWRRSLRHALSIKPLHGGMGSVLPHAAEI